jgi:hypothetical protein
MAITVSAPVFAFHTARFVAAAVQLYEHLGYQRAPWRALRHPRARADPLLAYRRDLVGPSPIHTHRSTRFFMPAEGLE